MKKTKRLAFKKAEPPVSDEKRLGTGKECSGVSNIGPEVDILNLLGSKLTEAGMYDLGCNMGTMKEKAKEGKSTKLSVKFPNSVRVCTYLDIVLRYMDKVKVEKKRWFFNAIEAKLYNHPLK